MYLLNLEKLFFHFGKKKQSETFFATQIYRNTKSKHYLFFPKYFSLQLFYKFKIKKRHNLKQKCIAKIVQIIFLNSRMYSAIHQLNNGATFLNKGDWNIFSGNLKKSYFLIHVQHYYNLKIDYLLYTSINLLCSQDLIQK